MYKYSHHYYGGRSLDPHTVKDHYYDNKFRKHNHHNNCIDGDCKTSCTLHPEFSLMRRTSNYFYNVPYHVNECININTDSMIEYDIHLPNMLVNFKKRTSTSGVSRI